MNQPEHTTAVQLTPYKGSQIVLTGEVSSVKTWLDGAARCEAAKLYCQVMAGFELAILWKQAGIQNGGDRKSEAAKSVSQVGNLISHDRICEEIGESKSQVYRYMAMAKICAIRLKRVPELSDFNPLNTPIATLPQPKIDALQAVVHKLTDGQTQREFCERYGLWKMPQGSGAVGRKPGEGGRRKLSLSEQAELLKLQAEEDWKSLQLGHLAYRAKFCCLSDLDVEAQLAVLDQAAKARRAWLAQPKDRRDVQSIDALFTL